MAAIVFDSGHVQSLDIVVGRRIALGEAMNLTPRAWVLGSRASVDNFTDGVNSPVSLPDAERLTRGAGMTVHAWDDGSFSLRGSGDFERILGGARTIARVSGEELSLEAVKNNVLLDLSAEYRHSHFSLGADVWYREGLDSDAREYSSILNLGIRF